MFIAIIGTPSAGKHTVLEYLVQCHGFTRISIAASPPSTNAVTSLSSVEADIRTLSIDPPSPSPSLVPNAPSRTLFSSPSEMLEHITRHWRGRYVTTSLTALEDVEPFMKRPFFLLVAVDGPLRTRYERERARARAQSLSPSSSNLTLDEFIDQHDALVHGTVSLELMNGAPAGRWLVPQHENIVGAESSTPTSSSSSSSSSKPTDFARLFAQAGLTVYNRFSTVAALHEHLDALDLLDGQRLRPGWDLYFMTLASLASHRSNCMKRRVGAVLVRSKRILSTGYNGTPRGTTNCNEGGCPRCNGPAKGGESLNVCLCLHAEENALLEAGRERIGPDSVLYCNTCPCLLCSVKIVQCGVKEVVYNQTYSMDEASARVLKDGGVVLRQLLLPPQ